VVPADDDDDDAFLLLDFLPVFFQGVVLDSPVKSGVNLFGVAFTVAPAAIACGVSVATLNFYKPQNIIGWTFTIVGFGLFSMVGLDSPPGWKIGFQIVVGIGMGINYAAPVFPILAASPITESAHALALLAFVRSLAQTFGVTIGSTVLQNELEKKLPSAFLDTYGITSSGAEIAYSVIPVVPLLPQPLKDEVRVAFAQSVAVIWRVMIGISAAGLLGVLVLGELKMHEVTDEDWGIEEKRKEQQRDVEQQQQQQEGEREKAAV